MDVDGPRPGSSMTHFTIEESNGIVALSFTVRISSGIELDSHLELCKSKVLSQRKDCHETDNIRIIDMTGSPYRRQDRFPRVRTFVHFGGLFLGLDGRR
jgi:hypothetical protein